jgi:hypothetical protein
MLIRKMNLKYTTKPHITYTPCYDQYGLFVMNFIRTTEQNFLKMWVGKLKHNIYI